LYPISKENLSVVSVDSDIKGSAKTKLIGPIALSQTRFSPIDALKL